MAQPPRTSSTRGTARTTQRVPTRPVAARAPHRPEQRATCGGAAGLALLALLAVVGVAGYFLYDRTFGAVKATVTKDVRERPKGDAPPPPLLQQPFNVLLIGVDLREARPDEGARSDTLIVAHVDPVDKWASMLSIPRDSYVQIPKLAEGGDRINKAYSYGYSNPDIYQEKTTPEAAGAALVAETVEQFLDIKIDYTAQIDFRGFEKLVDAIGGITIDVPHAILDAEYPTEDEGYMRLMIEPGLQRMDGVTALRYARTRHADNDFGRSQRQQQVIQTALSEIKRRGTLGKLEAAPQLLSALRESVKTTMPIDDLNTLRGLAALAQEMGTDRIQRFALNPDTAKLDENFDNRYIIHWDRASVQELAQQFEQGPEQAQAVATGTASAEPETATIQVQNGKGIKGLARSVTIDLQLAGYTVNDAADAPKGEHPHTLILDYSNKPQTREKLAKLFKVDPQYVKDESASKDNAPFGVDIVVLLGQDYDPQAQAQGMAPTQ